jgi:acid phosphatase (class A)
MHCRTAGRGALLCLVAALATGCASVVAPTSPDELPQVRPNYVIGYLQQAGDLPDSQAIVPRPPAPGTAAFAADEELYKATRKLRDTPRWVQATKDADLLFPAATDVFSCALDMPISAEATPHLNMLLRRVRADASRSTDRAKDFYKRKRPFAFYNEQNCTPREKFKDDSYPSGHASIGWGWALVLSEIAPDRANAVLARGLSFGMSRVVCGVHWKSDVEAGRIMAAATVSRLHVDPVFTAQLAAARKEVEQARAAGLKSPRNCAAEAQALATGP